MGVKWQIAFPGRKTGCLYLRFQPYVAEIDIIQSDRLGSSWCIVMRVFRHEEWPGVVGGWV